MDAKRRNIVVWAVIVSALIAVLLARKHQWRSGAMRIEGAVVRRDDDPRKQVPISGAMVTVSNGTKSASTQSDASGYFKVSLRGVVWPGQTAMLSFRHPDYQPLDMEMETSIRLSPNRLYVAAMVPIAQKPYEPAVGPASVVSNVRVRYTVNSQTEVNLGSAVKTFQVVNQANVPCNGRRLCSPDGSWAASTGSVSLDAGNGNEFRNVRVSCIAGPCPFTRIDASRVSNGSRTITESAIDWSDTATFLLEAEVFHTALSSRVRESYPAIFGRVLDFTLPPTEEGVSLEAEIGGVPMVFPLGLDLDLSWAACTVRETPEEGKKSMAYRCELKPGYTF